MKYFVDLTNVESKEDFHKAIRKALPLPEHYGNNLDALYDALWDMTEEAEIEIMTDDILSEEMEEYMDSFMELAHRVSEEKPNLSICFVKNDWLDDEDSWVYKNYIMVVGILMAAGTGSRTEGDLPKQFMPIKDKPLLIMTLDNMLRFEGFDMIVIAAPEGWEDYTGDLINRYLDERKRENFNDSMESPDSEEIQRPIFTPIIEVIPGGGTRGDSLNMAINYIEDKYGEGRDIQAVTQDAARPFITKEMIIDSLFAAGLHGASTAAIPAVDTIAIESDYKVMPEDIKIIGSIPNREELFQIQTPQSFDLEYYLECYEKLEGNTEFITDAAGVFIAAGKDVAMIKGDRRNIKITYPEDFKIAEAILEDWEKEQE